MKNFRLHKNWNKFPYIFPFLSVFTQLSVSCCLPCYDTFLHLFNLKTIFAKWSFQCLHIRQSLQKCIGLWSGERDLSGDLGDVHKCCQHANNSDYLSRAHSPLKAFRQVFDNIKFHSRLSLLICFSPIWFFKHSSYQFCPKNLSSMHNRFHLLTSVNWSALDVDSL